MDIKQLKDDALAGKVSIEMLIEIITDLMSKIKDLEGKNPTPRLDEAYSEKAEAKRKNKKQRRPKLPKRRRGRVTTAEKIANAQRTEKVYPDECDAAKCQYSHTRVAWRLENGTAVLVAYEIYRCGKWYGKPAGLSGRSEFGIEIVIALSYQVYCLGLSIDKAIQLLSFFQQLKLSKSQADALLNQLARQWESEFEKLCELLANSAVVHCDETSWSINSVWAFLNDKLTVLFYGVHKDNSTLSEILDKETFDGVLVSDNAAVYKNFNQAQKCWAHLIRKAIKLTLQSRENEVYRTFADGLLEIYRKAKKAASDGRLGDQGRKKRVEDLKEAVYRLCRDRWLDDSTDGDTTEEDYRRLCNEIINLHINDELFTFVLNDGVDGNNNAAERQLRGDALARETDRTNKTPNGAKRQSIISSVIQSIGKQLETFTLEAVIAEVQRWEQCGRSCFEELINKLGLNSPSRKARSDPNKSLLDQLILEADTSPE